MRILMLARTIGAALAIAAGTVPAAHGAQQATPLTSRIATAGPDVIGHFEAAGMRSVRPYLLTPAELGLVEKAFARMPALHRRILETNLRHLSFVDGIPGLGSGLTSKVGDRVLFDITLRASLLHASLTDFVTTRERRLFEADGSGRTITIDASGADALTYVLLHEATHILDMTSHLTSQPGNAFGNGIWEAPKDQGRVPLAAPLATSPAAASGFRDAARIPAGRARYYYDALAQTPFVSFYATASPAEDLAELVAWHVVSERYGATLAISVRDATGAVLQRYEPARFPAVQARMPQVDQLLEEAERDGAS